MQLKSPHRHAKGSYLFGIIWMLFSSIFVVIGLWMAYSSLKQSMWSEVPCVVTKLQVKASLKLDPPFQPKTSYNYEFDNTSYTGHKVSHSQDAEEDFEKLGELLEKQRKKEIKFCYVNPQTPGEAVLIKQSSWEVIGGIAFAAFGSFFVLIGFFIIRQNRKKSGAITSSVENHSGGLVIMVIFFSIFALAGCTTMIFMGKRMLRSISAQNWQETPAKVIWSRVVSDDSGDSTTYRPEVFYRYQFNGSKYRSNSYKISKSSSSGYASKQKVIDTYPRGKSISCYVNPEKPWQAIIQPKIGLGWLWLLFPLPFLLVGVGGLIMLFLKKDKQSITSNKAVLSSCKKKKEPTPSASGEVVYTPGKKRLLWLLGSIVIALFWNGIVSFLFVDVLRSWRAGDPDWFLTLFSIPFIVVGIGMILHFSYRLLTLLNPAPKLTLSNSQIIMGDSVQLTWLIPRGAHKITRFEIFLKGAEEATYERGTNTATAHSTFYKLGIIDTKSSLKSGSGSKEITLPAQSDHLMPSWEGEYNAIIWTLEIKGKIPFWPDLSESYQITVSPPNLSPVS